MKSTTIALPKMVKIGLIENSDVMRLRRVYGMCEEVRPQAISLFTASSENHYCVRICICLNISTT